VLYGSIPPPAEAAAKTPVPKEAYVIPQKNCVRWGTPSKQLYLWFTTFNYGRGLVCGGVVPQVCRVCSASGLQFARGLYVGVCICLFCVW
jgi:hypothetical protein